MSKSIRFKDFLHYRIERGLGGNMAQVYLALDTQNLWRVVLKLIDDVPDKEADIEAERNGAEQQRRMSGLDPRVPQIHDLGKQEDVFYVVMEYIEGEDLSQAIRRSPIPAERAVKYAIELCGLIENAQRHNIIHGDLKPSNVRITNNDQVKVLDFGIAKALKGSRKSTRNVFRSTEYASPERIDKGTMSVESDLWSVGILLYEMVSGLNPFRLPRGLREGRDAAAVERDQERILLDYPRRGNLAPLPGLCPEPLKRVIEKMLAPQPADRYAAPAAFRADLERFLRREYTQAEEEAAREAAAYDAPTTRTSVPLPDAPTLRTSTPLPDAPLTQPLPQPPPRPVQPPPRQTAQVITPAFTPSPVRKPPLALRSEPTKSRRWAFIVVPVLLLLAYLILNEISVWNGARAIEPELELAASPTEVQSVRALYQALARRSWLGLGLQPGRGSLREKLVARAQGEIDRYRNVETAATVRKSNWQQAEESLRWAMELGRDNDAAAMLNLSEGHVLRIADKHYEAVRKFEAAAQLKSDWPDPYIGLARVYSYDLKNPQKAMEANQQAAQRGYNDNRSTAFEADNSLLLAQRLFKQAQGLRGQTEEKNLLAQVKENCQKAIDLYGSIITFGNSSSSRERARRLQEQVDERIAEIDAAANINGTPRE